MSAQVLEIAESCEAFSGCWESWSKPALDADGTGMLERLGMIRQGPPAVRADRIQGYRKSPAREKRHRYVCGVARAPGKPQPKLSAEAR